MMGQVDPQRTLFYQLSLETFVPAEHPLRAIRPLIDDQAIRQACRDLYAPIGRPSIPPAAATGCKTPMLLFSTRASHGIRSGSLLPELLGEPDENSFGTPDVAEPIHVFILNHVADELRAAFAESGERIVEVFYGEHDA